MVFAAAFGTAAAQKGLSLLEAVLLSGIVYAGAAQLVSLELWTDRWTLAAVVGISVLTFTVNARMILQGASLHSWIGRVPGPVLWPSLFLLTDASWVMGERYRASGGRDAGVLIGGGLALWVFWVIGTIPGQVLGGLIQDPRRFGIDLVVPIFFVAMAVPLWKGSRDGVIWTIAAAAAVASWLVLPGYAFIVIGALTGALAGAFLPEKPDG
jgi:predicted branched-subunit amino acid permease